MPTFFLLDLKGFTENFLTLDLVMHFKNINLMLVVLNTNKQSCRRCSKKSLEDQDRLF